MNFEKTKNLIGRILISAIFIYAAHGKIRNFEKTFEVIVKNNIPPTFATFLFLLAIIYLVFGSLHFISGYKQKSGAYLLLIFIVPTTLIFHFSPFQIKATLMNAALIGGLLFRHNNVKGSSLKELFNNQTIKK